MDLLKVLRLLSDENRVRILRLLAKEELSVADLQQILGMGQSRISMQLSQLKTAGFVEVRRAGQKSMYRATYPTGSQTILSEVLERSRNEIKEAAHDDETLNLILNQRKDTLRTYFDELAGKFGRDYVPGRSWKALSEMMLRLLPPLEIADLGAGEGTLSLLLAPRAKRVIAIDNSQKMVDYGRNLAIVSGLRNLEYQHGDLEDLPLRNHSVDMALMHQTLHHALHPQKALEEAFRIIRRGGRIVILDLVKHDFEAARELYADVWFGFSQVDLIEMMKKAGFKNVTTSVVDKESEPPFFETLMAIGEK